MTPVSSQSDAAAIPRSRVPTRAGSIVSTRWQVRSTSALGLFLAATLLMSSNYRLVGPFPVDLTANRLAMLFLIAAWLLGVLAVRTDWPAEASRFNRPLAWIAGISVVMLVAGAPTLIQNGMLGTGIKRLIALGGLVLAYSLTISLVKSRAHVETVVRILVGLGAISAASGILERLTGSNPLRLAMTRLPFEEYQFTEEMLRASGSRVYGTAGHPIEFGAMMSMLLPLGLYLALTATTRVKAAKYWAATSAIALAMMFSVSRSSLLAAALGLLVLAALSKARAAVTIGVAVATGLLAVNLAYPDLLATLARMLDPSWIVAQEATAFSGRMQDWPIVFEMIKAHPLVGVGYDLFDPRTYFFLDNQYLKFALELGVMGLAAVLWFLGRALFTLLALARRRRDAQVPLEAALLSSSVSFVVLGLLFDTFGFFQVTNLFFVIVGLTVVLASTAAGPVRKARAV